jgi:hypothetical protein
VLCCAVLCCAVLCCAVLCCEALHCVVPVSFPLQWRVVNIVSILSCVRWSLHGMLSLPRDPFCLRVLVQDPGQEGRMMPRGSKSALALQKSQSDRVDMSVVHANDRKLFQKLQVRWSCV